MTQLSLISAMYDGQALPLLIDPDEETKEPELLINLSKATFAQEEMLKYNYAGNDQKAIVEKLASLNPILESVFKSYSSLCSVQKRDGQPGNELAAQVLSVAGPSILNLFSTIENLCLMRTNI